MGLSGSFLSPGRRLARTSSDTGNNAEINGTKVKVGSFERQRAADSC